MYNPSGKIVRGGGSWTKFEMTPFDSPIFIERRDKGTFVSLQEKGREKGDFVPLGQGEEGSNRGQEAENILKKARQKATLLEKEGYEKGFAQGEKDGFEFGKKKINRIIENIEHLAAEMHGLKREILRSYEREILEIIFAIAEKIVHQHVRFDNKLIKETIFNALRLAAERSRVVMKINPEDYDYIERLRPELFAQFKEIRSITIHSDPHTTRGGCLLETSYGDVDASIETQLDKIHASLLEAYNQKKDER